MQQLTSDGGVELLEPGPAELLAGLPSAAKRATAPQAASPAGLILELEVRLSPAGAREVKANACHLGQCVPPCLTCRRRRDGAEAAAAAAVAASTASSRTRRQATIAQ